MIKIKCDYINGAIAVPTDVIDKHLKLAPAASFKVLLFILRNSDCTTDAQQISAGTGLSTDDVSDCLIYWQNYGILSVDDKVCEGAPKKALGNLKSAVPVEETAPAEKKTVPLNIRSLPVKKPTQREIALRMKDDTTLQNMYAEAQSILGTFGYDTQAILLMIHDFYGMSSEVIITLLTYQKSIHHTASSAIKARAEDWAKRGIITLEDVNNELLALEKIDVCYNAIKGCLGSQTDRPTPRLHKFIRDWVVEWDCSPGLIIYALEENDKVLTDANKLLKKLARQGIKTPEQAREKMKKTLPQSVKKTYETSDVGKKSVLDWVKKSGEGETE